MDIVGIFEEFREMGLVAEQRDFGRFFGRSRSWFSSSLARQRAPSTEALMFFMTNLNKLISKTATAAQIASEPDEQDAYQAGEESLRVIYASVQAAICHRVMSQAQTVED